MKSSIVILSLTLALPTALNCQPAIRDLENKLPSLRDTVRIDSINRICESYLESANPLPAEQLADLAYKEASVLHYIHGMAVARSLQGSIQTHLYSNFTGAETFDRAAIRLFDETPDKNGLTATYDHLAFVCFTQCKYDEAFQIENRVYRAYAANRDTAGMIGAISLIGQIHLKRGEFEEGFNAAEARQQLGLQSHDSQSSKESSLDFGSLCMGIEDYPSALHYYSQYFQRFTTIDSIRLLSAEDLIWAKMEYAEIYAHLGKWDSALRIYNRLDTAYLTEKDLRIFLVSKGEYCLLSGQYKTALTYLTRGLISHKKLNDGNEVVRTVLDIAETYYDLHNDREALRYAREGLDLGLQSHARQRMRDAYKLLYWVYDRRRENDSAYFYYKRYIRTKESLSADQTKGRFAAKAYLDRIELLNSDQLINEQQLKIQDQQLKKASLTRYILIGLVIVVLLVTGLIIRNILLTRRNEKLKADNTRKELMQKSAEMEMQALRSQMNPHFIFNCLNSINRFIIKNEPQAASDYLTQFSRLIRLVLNNSKKGWILLDDEIDMLRLYLEMEKLRFKDAFSYVISCDEGTEPCALYIPPLLIQPFVENAVWHGLMHKNGSGIVTLNFSVINDILYCTVTDNGVGRPLEARSGIDSHRPQRSMGIQITKQRLELINDGLNKEIIFNIEDLTDLSGAASGTRVNLGIKFRRNYELETIDAPS
ncbi:MAG TPA: histidine kinase [Puia sp.]|nr:histidine kinase [Puia sp.]